MMETEYLAMLYVASIMLLLCGCGAAMEWFCNYCNKKQNNNNKRGE